MRKLILPILACALAACAPKRPQPPSFERVLSFRSDPAPQIPRLVERVEYLPLESTGAAAFRSIDKIVFRNGLIYVGDFRSRKIIAFDRSGRAAFVVDRYGRGAGEYLELRSFAVDDRMIYLIDNFSGCIHRYDAHAGAFRGKIPLPVVAWDVETLDNGDFLLAYVPLQGGALGRPQPAFRLLVADRDFTVKRGLFACDHDEGKPLARQTYFTVSGDSLLFSSFRFDGYTVLSRKDAAAYRQVGIAFDRGIPFRRRHEAGSFTESRYTYLLATPFRCGNYLSVDVSAGDYAVNYLYDFRSGAFFANPDEVGPGFLFAPVGNDGERPVSLLPNERYDEMVARGFPRASPEVERRLRQGDAVLLFYELRGNGR